MSRFCAWFIFQSIYLMLFVNEHQLVKITTIMACSFPWAQQKPITVVSFLCLVYLSVDLFNVKMQMNINLWKYQHGFRAILKEASCRTRVYSRTLGRTNLGDISLFLQTRVNINIVERHFLYLANNIWLIKHVSWFTCVDIFTG